MLREDQLGQPAGVRLARGPDQRAPTTSALRRAAARSRSTAATATRRTPIDLDRDGGRPALLRRGRRPRQRDRAARSPSRRATRPSRSDLEYDTEPAWDFAFVQVWTTSRRRAKGGWVSLANENTTTTQADPRRRPAACRPTCRASPAASGGVTAQTFNLGDYAGRERLARRAVHHRRRSGRTQACGSVVVRRWHRGSPTRLS